MRLRPFSVCLHDVKPVDGILDAILSIKSLVSTGIREMGKVSAIGRLIEDLALRNRFEEAAGGQSKQCVTAQEMAKAYLGLMR